MAASAIEAHCPQSAGWLGSCHLQRGGLPSGTLPSGHRSPAWGAVRSPPMSSSAPASIWLGKVATETWPSVDTDPRGLPGWSLLPLVLYLAHHVLLVISSWNGLVLGSRCGLCSDWFTHRNLLCLIPVFIPHRINTDGMLFASHPYLSRRLGQSNFWLFLFVTNACILPGGRPGTLLIWVTGIQMLLLGLCVFPWVSSWYGLSQTQGHKEAKSYFFVPSNLNSNPSQLVLW